MTTPQNNDTYFKRHVSYYPQLLLALLHCCHLQYSLISYAIACLLFSDMCCHSILPKYGSTFILVPAKSRSALLNEKLFKRYGYVIPRSSWNRSLVSVRGLKLSTRQPNSTLLILVTVEESIHHTSCITISICALLNSLCYTS